MHLIGASLHQKSGIPWIADFRDPWTDWEFLDTLKLSRWARAKHAKLEQKVLQSASHILTISPTFAEHLRDKGGKAAISVLTNGYDAADVRVLPEIDPATSQINIIYAGVIDAIRDPRPFFKACKSLPEELQSKWQIDFVGKVSEKIKEEVGNDPQLKDHVFFRGYVSHQEVFDYYEKADLLLLVLTNTKNAKGNIPGKIFEYATSGRFILALGDPEGDAAQIIHQYQIGKVFAHDQIEALRDFLLTVINDKSSLRVKSDQVMAYERKNLTHQLAKILDQYVKDPFHDLSRALKEMQPQYLEVMSQVLSGDSLIHGKQVSLLEQKLSEHLGRSVVTCANGSDALEIILEVYEIGVGDEVILSPLTWVSNAEAVIRAGAIPVLAPLDERTGLIDSTRLSSLITKRTKAIIPVHLYGQMVPMQPILDLAEEHQLIIIEDCAQAFGAKQKGELAGTWGHAAAYSFYPTKNLGALGDGGAMAFADPLKAQRGREIANHGQSKRDVHQRLGRNSRLDTLQAAFLLENLKHL